MPIGGQRPSTGCSFAPAPQVPCFALRAANLLVLSLRSGQQLQRESLFPVEKRGATVRRRCKKKRPRARRNRRRRAVCLRRLHVAERQSADKRGAVGHEILHAGDPGRRRLRLRLQPSEGRHDRRFERGFRSNEVQVTQLGVGGDFHYDNVRARLMTQFGLYSETTPRNDASPARGQWNLADAYRYVSEAYGGYHFNALHGINVDAEFSCLTSDCSATTNLTIGRISLRMFLPTRRGSSTACAFRFFPPSI